MVHSPSQDVVILCIKLDVILFKVCVQLVRSQNLGDFNKLIIVVMTVEEGLFSENLKSIYG
jgi:hypothetical protein